VFLAFASLLCGSVEYARAATRIDRIRYFSGPEHTRVVLDLSGSATYEVRRVRAPERLAVNVFGARFAGVTAIEVGDDRVRRIRRNAGGHRAQVVLDLAGTARHEVFDLAAAAGRPHRIVIDLFPMDAARSEPVAEAADERRAVERPFVVVIDPGHGGLDPGAIRDGVQEKDVVLDVSRRVAKRLDALPQYRAVLTRDRDWYPSLGRRVQIAREEAGDLFLSVHCNTHRRRNVRGMEVYFLSLQGATDREAQELADVENAADLVGLAPDEPRNDLVVSILMDLRMTRVLHDSQRLCLSMLDAARASDVIPARKVKQARFQVLRSLAMPSALVELAYLSNKSDRQLLDSEEGREQLAAVLVDGIRRYRERGDGLIVAATEPSWSRNYRVQRGDSLWRLAKRHRTTIDEIARKNDLRSSRLRVGQILTLPEIE
jgi:N-acetylmuramoyl-L-alanine amidase